MRGAVRWAVLVWGALFGTVMMGSGGCSSRDYAALEIALQYGELDVRQVELTARLDNREVLPAKKIPAVESPVQLSPGETIVMLFSVADAGGTVAVSGKALRRGMVLREVSDTSDPLVAGDTKKVILDFEPTDGGSTDTGVLAERPSDRLPDRDPLGSDAAPPDSVDAAGDVMDVAQMPPDSAVADMVFEAPIRCFGLGTCDVVAQTGCAASEECAAVCPQPACRPNNGAQGAGASCTPGAPNDCDRGLFCLENGNCGTRCVKLCCDDSGCPSGFTCSANLVCSAQQTIISGYCLNTSCDPYGDAAATSCPDPKEACYPLLAPLGNVHARCTCRGTLPPDAECTSFYQCQPGYVCLGQGAGMPAICRQVCNRESPVCRAGLTCRGINNYRAGACLP